MRLKVTKLGKSKDKMKKKKTLKKLGSQQPKKC